jgi:hypothetical protein
VIRRAVAYLALAAWLAGCSTAPEPAPSRATAPVVIVAAPATSPPPATPDAGAAPLDTGAPAPAPSAGIREAKTVDYADMPMRQLSEKEWLGEVRERLARTLKVEPAELRFSADRTKVAAVRGPPPPPAKAKPPRKPKPRRWQLLVVGVDGKRPRTIRPVTVPHSDEPPKDLRFLADGRLLYEVVLPPAPATPPPAPRKKPGKDARKVPAPAGKQAPRPLHPERLVVIQPLGRRARPVRCQGTRFAFAGQGERMAFVAGPPEAGFVSVEGAQTYPRRGRTVIASDLAWSKDAHSLAFVEKVGDGPRLVLLAEWDNPTGDTTWDLPASIPLEGLRVFWAGPEKLVVGRSQVKPIFSTSFTKKVAGSR